jgi:hypothetical protein
MMRVHVVTNPKPPATLGYHDFLAFASVVDDQQYLNVLLRENADFEKPDPAKLDKWDSEVKAAYFLLEVQHSDSAMRLRTMDLEYLAKHVTEEDVPGKIRRTSNGQIAVVELTASTKELAQFVSEHQDSVFDRSQPGARIARLGTLE